MVANKKLKEVGKICDNFIEELWSINIDIHTYEDECDLIDYKVWLDDVTSSSKCLIKTIKELIKENKMR